MNGAERKVTTQEFFSLHPVFSLDRAVQGLAPAGQRDRTRERLRYHLDRGNLKLLARGLYAVVPAGVTPERFQPDGMQVAAVERPDALFCHHSALELLGAAHSAWRDCTVFTARRRKDLQLGDTRIRFLQVPAAMKSEDGQFLGSRRIEYRGKLLACTGPERTLVEGFRRPSLVGGHEELLVSAGGFATLDLGLLEEVLRRYAAAKLWAATGWFLERFRNRFHVSEDVLRRWEKEVPASPQYLERMLRGGQFFRRWNLVVARELEQTGGPDEP
jgi:predicted transcriptional regulator of viral defense system